MQRIAVACALLLFAAAAARAVTSGYESRRRQLSADAEAQRSKLKLPQAKLYAQYPTPEVYLVGEAQQVACGGDATVQVKGSAPKGTAFLLSDDDVQILEEKATADGWRARVKVAQNATPRDVTVHAIAPVSDAERAQRALRIRGRYELDLKFDDGWTAHFGAANAAEGMEGELAWKKGGDARTTPARIDWSSDQLRIEWQRSQEELDAMNAATEKLQSANLEESAQKAMGRVEACLKKADPARTACLDAAEKQNDAEIAAVKKKIDAVEAEAESKRPTAAWGCKDAQLQSVRGVLTGVATCAPNDRKLKVSGALKCLGPVTDE